MLEWQPRSLNLASQSLRSELSLRSCPDEFDSVELRAVGHVQNRFDSKLSHHFTHQLCLVDRAVVPEEDELLTREACSHLLEELNCVVLVEELGLGDEHKLASLARDPSHDCESLRMTLDFTQSERLVWQTPGELELILRGEDGFVNLNDLLPLAQSLLNLCARNLSELFHQLRRILRVVLLLHEDLVLLDLVPRVEASEFEAVKVRAREELVGEVAALSQRVGCEGFEAVFVREKVRNFVIKVRTQLFEFGIRLFEFAKVARVEILH